MHASELNHTSAFQHAHILTTIQTKRVKNKHPCAQKKGKQNPNPNQLSSKPVTPMQSCDSVSTKIAKNKKRVFTAQFNNSKQRKQTPTKKQEKNKAP